MKTIQTMKKQILKMYEIEYGNEDYPYSVRIYNNFNGVLYYTGIGRYCKSIDEIDEYILKEVFEKMNGVFSKHGYIFKKV